jgi:hypothetical protein
MVRATSSKRRSECACGVACTASVSSSVDTRGLRSHQGRSSAKSVSGSRAARNPKPCGQGFWPTRPKTVHIEGTSERRVMKVLDLPRSGRRSLTRIRRRISRGNRLGHRVPRDPQLPGDLRLWQALARCARRGAEIPRVNASRVMVHSRIWDWYRPSRRSTAALLPRGAASYSATTLARYSAVNERRTGRAAGSGTASTEPDTESSPAPAAESGRTEMLRLTRLSPVMPSRISRGSGILNTS